MQLSEQRYRFIQNYPLMEERILILSIGHAQELMNLRTPFDPLGDIALAKLQAKAVELLNQPETFRDRLVLSVVSLMTEDDLDEGVDDVILEELIDDAFDALAGVTGKSS